MSELRACERIGQTTHVQVASLLWENHAAFGAPLYRPDFLSAQLLRPRPTVHRVLTRTICSICLLTFECMCLQRILNSKTNVLLACDLSKKFANFLL